MSLLNEIPKNSRPIQTESIFTATFNVPTLARYDFGIPANVGVFAHRTNKQSVYYLDRTNFSLDIGEALFKEAIDVSPKVRVVSQETGTQKFQSVIPFINYVDNLAYTYFYTEPNGRDIQLTLFGSLTQPVGLVGRVTVRALVQLNVYEIVDKSWILAYNNMVDTRSGGAIRKKGTQWEMVPIDNCEI